MAAVSCFSKVIEISLSRRDRLTYPDPQDLAGPPLAHGDLDEPVRVLIEERLCAGHLGKGPGAREPPAPKQQLRRP